MGRPGRRSGGHGGPGRAAPRSPDFWLVVTCTAGLRRTPTRARKGLSQAGPGGRTPGDGEWRRRDGARFQVGAQSGGLRVSPASGARGPRLRREAGGRASACGERTRATGAAGDETTEGAEAGRGAARAKGSGTSSPAQKGATRRAPGKSGAACREDAKKRNERAVRSNSAPPKVPTRPRSPPLPRYLQLVELHRLRRHLAAPLPRPPPPSAPASAPASRGNPSPPLLLAPRTVRSSHWSALPPPPRKGGAGRRAESAAAERRKRRPIGPARCERASQ